MQPVKSIHHLGVAVRSIDAQRAYYEQTLGGRFEGIETVADQQTRVAFFAFEGLRVELLEPTSDAGPIARFLEKRGEGLHHIAYLVDDLPARIAELKREGLTMIDESPRSGAHQMQVAFVHPKSTFGVLTELCQPAKAGEA